MEIKILHQVMLSVDVGKKGAWCIWHLNKPVKHGLINCHDRDAIYRLLNGVEGDFDITGRFLLVIENQFLGRNPMAFKSLIEGRNNFETLAWTKKWDIHSVAPSVWQKVALANEQKKAGEDIKCRSMRVAERLLGEVPVNDNLADAVCIGYYAHEVYSRIEIEKGRVNTHLSNYASELPCHEDQLHEKYSSFNFKKGLDEIGVLIRKNPEKLSEWILNTFKRKGKGKRIVVTRKDMT